MGAFAIRNKKFSLLSIILFLSCCWNTFLFSMEERETPEVVSEGSSTSNEVKATAFKFLIGGEEFEVSSTIVQHIKAIQNMIEDLEKSEEATEIDVFFPYPEAIEENQKNFKIIIALLSNQEHGYSYTMEDHISLLNCANKLNVEVVSKIGTAMLADHIDTVEEIDDELLNQLKKLNHHVFFQVCSQLKFIKPVLLDTLQICALPFYPPLCIGHIAFNKAQTRIACDFGCEIYLLDLENKSVKKIFEGEHFYKALRFSQDDKSLIAADDVTSANGLTSRTNKIIILDLNGSVIEEVMIPEFRDSSEEDDFDNDKLNDELFLPKIPYETFKRKIRWYIENKEKICANEDFAFDRSGKFLATARRLLFAAAKKAKAIVEVWDVSSQHNIENLKPIKHFECEDSIDSKISALHFHPKEPLLVIKVENRKKSVHYRVRTSIYIGNVQTGSLEKILNWNGCLYDIKFDSSGSNLYMACGAKKNNKDKKVRCPLLSFNIHTKKLIELFDFDYCPDTFDISDDESLIAIETEEGNKIVLYKLGIALAKQITNIDELCFLKKMERLRSEDKKLILCRHNNPEMYATYQGASFASDLSKAVQTGCSFNCYLQDIKQIVKKPLVIAGAVGAVVLAGYIAYKKWFRN